jgi:hypothetical protein
LARHLLAQGDLSGAKDVLSRSIEANPGAKGLHYELARVLQVQELQTGQAEPDAIEYHLRNAFTKRDRRYEAQFMYGRQLYINRKYADSARIFDDLKSAHVPPQVKRRARALLTSAGRPSRLTGNVVSKRISYAFVRPDGREGDAYLDERDCGQAVWSSLVLGTRLEFSLAFSYYGPVAQDVRLL